MKGQPAGGQQLGEERQREKEEKKSFAVDIEKGGRVGNIQKSGGGGSLPLPCPKEGAGKPSVKKGRDP